ncbi:MAG TPA: c-type cytochrome [Methylotenera sp.]|nr:c-type cytochrome [Methylotenera sp.]
MNNEFDKSKEQPIQSEQNEVSTLELHKDAMLETDEPLENMVYGPKWFYLLLVIALMTGSFYFGRHMARLDTTAHGGFLNKAAEQDANSNQASGQAPGQTSGQTSQPQQKTAAVSGAAIFTSRCSTCHQADGKGVAGAFPPLVGSPYVLGSPEVLVRIVLQGLQGKVDVEGQTYNGLMPAWASQLSNEEIAAVTTHVRNELGTNKGGKIEADTVNKIREETKSRQTPWTVEELKVFDK